MLKEQSNFNISLNFSRSTDVQNSLSYSFAAAFNNSNNAIVLNTVTDEIGRTNAFYTNAKGLVNINFNSSINKLYKIKNSQFVFTFSPTLSLTEQPNIINNLTNISNGISHAYNTEIGYDFNNRIGISVTQKQTYTTQKQNGITNQILKTISSEFNLNCNLQLSQKLLINTNVAYTKNTFNESSINNFTIWNASVGYRFLKGNNAGIKFTAFDILKQNTGLSNTIVNNNVSLGTQNTLQQYFLLTLAYFPRQFGKGD